MADELTDAEYAKQFRQWAFLTELTEPAKPKNVSKLEITVEVSLSKNRLALDLRVSWGFFEHRIAWSVVAAEELGLVWDATRAVLVQDALICAEFDPNEACTIVDHTDGRLKWRR